MNLLKVHVLEDDDLQAMIKEGECTSFDDIDCDTVDFCWDYHQIALINEDTGERLLWNDNIHTNIEDNIEHFLLGLKTAKTEYTVTEIAMMYEDVLKKFTGIKYRA